MAQEMARALQQKRKQAGEKQLPGVGASAEETAGLQLQPVVQWRGGSGAGRWWDWEAVVHPQLMVLIPRAAACRK